MSNFFDTISKSFADVPTANGIETEAFLEASEGLVQLFDLLGSTAFKVVQNDLSGNITKLRTRFNAAPSESATLEALVKNEQAVDKKRTATQGLLWLNRGLEFTAIALRRSLTDQKEELSVSFNKSYEASLKQFHSFVVRPIFTLAMKACPYRQDFYAKLGAPLDVVISQLEAWLTALEKIVAQINAFLPPYAKGL